MKMEQLKAYHSLKGELLTLMSYWQRRDLTNDDFEKQFFETLLRYEIKYKESEDS